MAHSIISYSIKKDGNIKEDKLYWLAICRAKKHDKEIKELLSKYNKDINDKFQR